MKEPAAVAKIRAVDHLTPTQVVGPCGVHAVDINADMAVTGVIERRKVPNSTAKRRLEGSLLC